MTYAVQPSGLSQAIAGMLSRSARPLRAREIARQLSREGLSVVRRDVNRVLYADLAAFARNDAWEWTVVSKASSAAGDGLWQELATDLPTALPPAAEWAADPRLYEWQRRALTAWLAASRRGIVSAVTGSGKTRVGLAAIEDHLMSDRRARAVVLVPTIELMRQWRHEIAHWFGVSEDTVRACGGGEMDRVQDGQVIVYVAASAAKWLPEEVAAASADGSVLLVADECHRYGAPTYSGALRGAYGATLGLSATPERSYDAGMERSVLPALGEVVFDYGYQEGLDDGTITQFTVAFVGVEFDPDEKQEYDELSSRISELRRSLDSRYPFLRSGREFFAQLNAIARREQEPLALAYLGAVGGRRAILMDAAARERFVEWLIDQLPRSRKAILFHERIDGAEWLADALNEAGIPAAAHHSELSRTDRVRVLQQFRDGELRALVAPRTLDEGIDVPDADVAVIVAGSTVKRQRIQRIGRVLRRASGKADAQIVVLYVRHSREDPFERPEGDAFTETIEALDRASYFDWPQQADDLASWLAGSSQGSNRVRGEAVETHPVAETFPIALVVSDRPSVVDEVAGQLTPEGVEVRYTDDANTAEAFYEEEAPAAVIVDRWFSSSAPYRSNQGGSDAFRFCQAIRAGRSQHAAVLILVDDQFAAPSSAFGVDHRLRLPLQPNELEPILARFVPRPRNGGHRP